MSQMPDKVFIHKNAKYSTGDFVLAYQYEFAEDIQEKGIENFVTYVPRDEFILKMLEWLLEHFRQDSFSNDTVYIADAINDEIITQFKNEMKE